MAFVGLDGGATSTSATALNENGTVLHRARKDSGSNPYLCGVGTAAQCLSALIHEVREALLQTSPALEVDTCCITLSGVDDTDMRSRVEAEINRLCWSSYQRLILVGDTTAGFGFLEPDRPGIVLVAGTGSVASDGCHGKSRTFQLLEWPWRDMSKEQATSYQRIKLSTFGIVLEPALVIYRFRDPGNGVDRRCGGWGHLVSDLGSSCSVATQALSDMILAMEGVPRHEGDRYERLWDECCTYFTGTDKLPALMDHIYGQRFSKSHVAGFAKNVAALARDDDHIATRIFRRAGGELGRLVRGALASDVYIKLNVVLLGGMFNSWDLFQDDFMNEVRSTSTAEIQFILPTCDPSAGSAVLALREKHGNYTPKKYLRQWTAR